MTLLIRTAIPSDADAAGGICFEAFKAIAEAHRFPPDFPSAQVAAGLLGSIIGRPDVFAVVAERDGQLVGSNFLWKGAVAGVGPITVRPEAQNAGAGRLLMQAVLDHARELDLPAVRLVQAGYHARSLSLYAKLGFVAREPLAVMQGPALKGSEPGHAVRLAVREDLKACNELCQRVHGHTRAGELLDAVSRNAATVVERDGRIVGYASEIAFFGHAVGENNEAVQALILAAREFGGPGFMVPTRNAALFRWCLDRGLRVVQPMTLMSVGMYNEPQGAFLPSVLF
jgi:predicted N-acetyltransferase YhbS